MSELCETCGRRYETVYRVPNDVWTKIAPRKDDLGPHPEHQYGGLLCPDCAAKAARDKGIELYFEASAGDWADNTAPAGALRDAADADLLAELYRRHGSAAAPPRVVEASQFEEILTADGKDHVIRILLEKDGPFAKATGGIDG